MKRLAEMFLSALLTTGIVAAAVAQSGGPPIDQPFTLAALGARKISGQQRPTLVLVRKDGALAAQGDTGCNQWNGQAAVTGAAFTLSNAVMTQRACADPAIMKVEQDFLSALESVKRWRMDGKALILEGDKGSLRFEPAAQN